MMLNDILNFLLSLIDFIASDVFLEAISKIDTLISLCDASFDDFELILSYVFYFVPPLEITILIGIVLVFLLLRILMAVVNLLYP